MEERLIQFINAEGLNASSLAEKIGVQRSSISHIISGRNKPSFDFIQKMINSFPNLNSQWLITGKGNMYSTSSPKQESLFDQTLPKKEQISTSESNIQNITHPIQKKSHPDEIKKEEPIINPNSQKTDSEIERIVIFYANGKFTEYKP